LKGRADVREVPGSFLSSQCVILPHLATNDLVFSLDYDRFSSLNITTKKAIFLSRQYLEPKVTNWNHMVNTGTTYEVFITCTDVYIKLTFKIGKLCVLLYKLPPQKGILYFYFVGSWASLGFL
jgi:hypothetical protein